MVATHPSSMTTISPKRLDKLSSKDYRHSYLKEMTTGWIVHQIRELRNERCWSQSRLGDEASKPQSAIARIEDPDYGKWSVSTLLEIAEAFDVALQVRFVDWPSFLSSTDDSSPERMRVPSFSVEAFTPKWGEISGRAYSAGNVMNIQVSSNVVDMQSAKNLRISLELDPNDRMRLSTPTSRVGANTATTAEPKVLENLNV